MSSNFTPIEPLTLRPRSSRAGARNPVLPWDADLTERQELMVSGAPQEVLQRFDERQTYNRLQEQADAFGMPNDGELSPGLLSSAFNTLDYGRANVFNFIRELAEEGSFDYQRFRQRVDDREAFRDLDWATPDKDASLFTRGAAALGRLAGDTVLDPWFYATLGASVLGRRLGAQAVAAHAAKQNAGRSIAGDALEDASIEVLRQNARRLSKEQIAQRLGTNAVDAAPFPGTTVGANMDSLLNLAQQQNLLRELAEEGLRAGMSQAYATGSARGLRQFLTGEAATTRFTSRLNPYSGGRNASGLSGEVGRQVQRQLPGEFRGGFGFRVPLSRWTVRDNVSGRRLPVKVTIAGPRAAKLLGLDFFMDIGNAGRLAMRNSAVGRQLNGLSGVSGKFYGEMIQHAHASLYMGVKGADQAAEPLGRVFSQFRGSDKSIDEARKFDRSMDQTLNTALNEIGYAWTAGATRNNVDGAAVRRRYNEFLADRAQLNSYGQTGLRNSRGQFATNETIDTVDGLAYVAALRTQDLENNIYESAVQILGQERAIGFINDFAPRILAGDERIRKQVLASAARRTGQKYDPRKPRTLWVKRWVEDPETGEWVPGEWLNSQEVNIVAGRRVFEDDPYEASIAYFEGMRSLLRNERLVKALENNGVASRIGVVTEMGIDETKAAQQVGRALNQAQRDIDDLQGVAGAPAAEVRGVLSRFIDPADLPSGRVTWTRTSDTVLEASDGARVVQNSDGTWNAQNPDGSIVNPWSDPARVRAAIPEPDEVFREVDAAEFVAAISRARKRYYMQRQPDGSEVKRRIGETVYQYSADEYLGMRLFLTADGQAGFALKPQESGVTDFVSAFNSSKKVRGRGDKIVQKGLREGADVLDAFDEFDLLPRLYRRGGFVETERVPWDPAYRQRGWRGGEPDVVYMRWDPEVAAEQYGLGIGFGDVNSAKRALSEGLKDERAAARINSLEDLRQEQIRQISLDKNKLESLLEEGLYLPEGRQISEFFNDTLELVGRYLDDVLPEDIGRRVTVDKYRKLVESEGLVSLSSPGLNQRLASAIEESGIFGPDVLRQTLLKAYKAQGNPEGYQRWISDVWQPLYQTMKLYMTSARGPGYIARNVIGGMWNAWLYDVRPEHFRRAAVLLQLRHSARRQAERSLGADAYPAALARESADNFKEAVRRKFGSESSEIIDAVDAFDASVLGFGSRAARTRGVQEPENMDGVARSNRAILAAQNNPWVRFWGGQAEASEDFLRLGTFLKGVDEFGLQDGGRAAGLGVKATQFDYGDLTSTERGIKNLWTFYTFTRFSVPLNFRGLFFEPEKINRLFRSNEELREMFGDPEAEEEFNLARWTKDRFSWVSKWSTSEGYPIVVGIESPLMDLNKIFLMPDVKDGLKPNRWVNWSEVINQANPILTQAADTLTGVDSFTRGQRDRTVESPGWADWVGGRAVGLSRTTPDGEAVSPSWAIRAAESLIPPLGLATRLAPGTLGNERQQVRRNTSWLSALAAAPVATLDPWQEASELRARQGRINRDLERNVPNLSMRRSYVNALLDRGATPDTVRETFSPVDRDIFALDTTRAISELEFAQWIQAMRDYGFDEQQIASQYWRQFGGRGFVPDSDYRPRGASGVGVRAGNPLSEWYFPR